MPRMLSALTAGGLAVLVSIVGLTATPVSADAAQSSDVRFTSGPGTGAPPADVHGVPVVPFGDDGRGIGEDVSTIGPISLSASVSHRKIGKGWATWSHGYEGDVYLSNDSVTLTLPARTSAISFYVEPDVYGEVEIEARSDDGTTSGTQVVQGEGGARYFGFYSTRPFSSSIQSITVSSPIWAFAVGEFAIASDLSPYAALGDSFSSGEGGFRPTPETDTATNRCHRDVDAYPVRLSKDDKDLSPLGFVACSGAVTRDVTHANHLFPSEAPQVEALTTLTRTVTLTIGGNDVGFSTVLAACITAREHADGRGCSTEPAVRTSVDARIAALAGTGDATAPGSVRITPVTQVLSEIHARSPKAHVYLAAYPELFGSRKKGFSRDESSPSGRSCRVSPLADAALDYADTQWLNAETRSLNATLQRAVKDAKKADASLEATFVKVPTFDDHGLCDKKTAWINPLVLPGADPVTPSPSSFHPTARGQRQGYYRAFQRHGL